MSGRLPREIEDRLTSLEEQGVRNFLERAPEVRDRVLGILETLLAASRQRYVYKPRAAMEDDPVNEFIWESLGVCKRCLGAGVAPPLVLMREGVTNTPWRKIEHHSEAIPEGAAEEQAGRCPHCWGLGRRGGRVRVEGDRAL